MKWGTRKDGRHYPKFQRVSVHHTAKRPDRYPAIRSVSKRSLENPLLWSNFVKKYEELNPKFDFEVVDRTLEPEEAIRDLQARYPDFRTTTEKQEEKQIKGEFRDYLCEEQGICNERAQNLVAKADPPLSDQQLGEVSYALSRPEHSEKIDKAMKAPEITDIAKWAKNPNRLDVKGIDDKK